MSAVRNYIVTFFLSVLIFGLIAFGLIRFTAAKLSATEKGGGDVTGEVGVETDEEGREDSGQDLTGVKGESFTILFVGTDYQPSVFTDYDVTGQKDENGFPKEPREILSDVLILVRVDKESGDCVFCAIPTDSKISIEGLNTTLSHLYSTKGITTLCSKVMAMTGLPIDYYAVITGENFRGLIDAMNGISYFVSANMTYEDPENALSVNLKKGTQKLSGKSALEMLRYPAYSDGEVSRRKTEVSFIKAMFKFWLTAANQKDASKLYNKYVGYFETNLTINDVTENAELIFAYSKMNLVEYTYPGTSGETYFDANVSKAVEYFSKYKFKG